MHRIATAMLIAAAVLALNAGMLRDAFAEQTLRSGPQTASALAQPVPPRSARLLSLLVILESLRQSPVAMDGQKV